MDDFILAYQITVERGWNIDTHMRTLSGRTWILCGCCLRMARKYLKSSEMYSLIKHENGSVEADYLQEDNALSL